MFGPGADVRGAFDGAKRTLARFPSDSALLDLIYETPERTSGYQADRPHRLMPLIRASSWALRNPRLAGCSQTLLVIG